MDLTKAKALVASVFNHPRVLECYAAGDRLSRNQTKHDVEHAFRVLALAKVMVGFVESDGPVFTDWEKEVVIPLGAFLHDIGRCIDVDHHDRAGAKWTMEFLSELTLPNDSETLPLETIKRIARIVACHRSSRYVNINFVDYCLDIVVSADKCEGDEDRVRPGRAAILRVLTWFRATWIPLRKGGVHDRVNFAMKESKPDYKDGIVSLRIAIDTRVCNPDLVYSLYADRFHCCVLAFAKFGRKFELVFNNEPYTEVKEGVWQKR